MAGSHSRTNRKGYLMIRTLRALTITSLACIAIDAAVVFLAICLAVWRSIRCLPQPWRICAAGPAARHCRPTGFYAAFAAGVVAIVASLQERRRGWAAALIALLIVLCYGVVFVDYLIVLVGARFMVGSIGTGSPLLPSSCSRLYLQSSY